MSNANIVKLKIKKGDTVEVIANEFPDGGNRGYQRGQNQSYHQLGPDFLDHVHKGVFEDVL